MPNLERSSQQAVRRLMSRHWAVIIVGPRHSGKSTLVREILPQSTIVDMKSQEELQPDERARLLENYAAPTILEDIHFSLDLFQAMAGLIKKSGSENGRFLITCAQDSEALRAFAEARPEVVVFELGGLHLEEAWQSEPSYFYDLMMLGKPKAFEGLVAERTGEQLITSCFYGAYPELFPRRDEPDHKKMMSDFYRANILGDVQQRYSNLNLKLFHRFVRLLSGASGHGQNMASFCNALEVQEHTVASLFRLSCEAMIWRQIPMFGADSRTRQPMGYLRDPGFLNHTLSIADVETMRAHVNFQTIWRSFLTEELLKGFQNRLIAVKPYYFQSGSGGIDLILKGDFGLAPIDINLGVTREGEKLKALERFVRDQSCPFGLVIDQTRTVNRLSEHIWQIPATCL